MTQDLASCEDAAVQLGSDYVDLDPQVAIDLVAANHILVNNSVLDSFGTRKRARSAQSRAIPAIACGAQGGVPGHAERSGFPCRNQKARPDGRSGTGEAMEAITRETMALPKDMVTALRKVLQD